MDYQKRNHSREQISSDNNRNYYLAIIYYASIVQMGVIFSVIYSNPVIAGTEKSILRKDIENKYYAFADRFVQNIIS